MNNSQAKPIVSIVSSKEESKGDGLAAVWKGLRQLVEGSASPV